MQIISGTTEFYIEKPTAVVIGKFDGVHVGHQKLLSELLKQRQKGLKTVVFTFDQSPVVFFSGEEKEFREICTAEEKRILFEELGIDILLEFPLNKETSEILPREFVTEILQKKLNCKFLAAGEDVSFGYRGAGNAELLMEYSQKGIFELEIMKKLTLRQMICEEVPMQKWEDTENAVSATHIRQEIGKGNVERANVLLGRAFSITGEVVHGNHLGSTVFNMPTANIVWSKHKVLPAFGVYFARIEIEGKVYNGISNIGTKPTITGEKALQVLAETYIYDFSADIYGKNITLSFYKFHRPEKRFSDLEALKKQLILDMEDGRQYWQQKSFKL